MNTHWSTINMDAGLATTGKQPTDVSLEALKFLLRGRRFGQSDSQNANSSTIIPTVPEYDSVEMSELEEYCAKRGILGFNCGAMAPSAALNMLRGKIEGRSHTNQTTAKKGLLNG